MDRLIIPLLVLTFFLSITLVSCLDSNKDQDLGKSPENPGKNTLTIPKDENKDRALWQKPEIVVSKMGNLSDRTVADIGAGTGYFTFRMALQAQKVIAIDIMPSYLEILDNLKEKLPFEIKSRIETRLAKENDPLLKPGEVDLVVIINTFSVIGRKIEYLKTLKKGLKSGGKVFIVDFKIKNIPIDAPPVKDRLPINELEDQLVKAGFKNIITDDTTLDFQYIVTAEK
ncbi:MAG: methyltransferase [Saprospiraceae bacterium]|nr:methyltransferase [Saprospiraceae bacterium]